MYEIFAKLLDERGITAYQVHKDTGVSQSVLSGWKNGQSTPRPMTLRIIADYFGVSVEYLKGETDDRGQKEKPAPVSGSGQYPHGYDLLTPEQKEIVDRLIADLAKNHQSTD